MGMGRRPDASQNELWIATRDIDPAPGHAFYDRLQSLLTDAAFDSFVERLCEPHYTQGGRPSIPPGVYFRMVFVGYFEGLDSQRQTAWRCRDSLSLRKFLGYRLTEQTPDHSSLTRIRKRLPFDVYQAVFVFVLDLCGQHGLLNAKTVGVDATTIEANAAMREIVRRDTGDTWKEYVKTLMAEEGLFDPANEDEHPTDDEIRRFDRKRTGKSVSNKDWKSRVDDDARIVKMKDGRTHLAYKAEHVVDLETEVILSATVYHGDVGDTELLLQSVTQAQQYLERTQQGPAIKEVVADKGYHSNQVLVDCEESCLRTYIPEPESQYERSWTDKSAEEEDAYRRNRRRVQGNRSKRLQRLRSERVERSFAHMCETGGGRRSWLRRLTNINKRYLLQAVSRNLGLILRKMLGRGTPRELWASALLIWVLCGLLSPRWRAVSIGQRFPRNDGRHPTALPTYAV